jgi:hypothetical protein
MVNESLQAFFESEDFLTHVGTLNRVMEDLTRALTSAAFPGTTLKLNEWRLVVRRRMSGSPRLLVTLVHPTYGLLWPIGEIDLNGSPS